MSPPLHVLKLEYYLIFEQQLHPSNKQHTAHRNDKEKIAVRVPLERDGLERAKPLVSKIYTREVMYNVYLYYWH